VKRHIVRLSPEAQTDLVHIHGYVEERAASTVIAERYIQRIATFLASFETFPERGTVRDEIRPGLRIVGFEHAISVAFVVGQDDVTILRILAGGQAFPSSQ
jgi:plasmid stabilization system protein ParE